MRRGSLLALTMGDPAGIGPEITAKAWAARADLPTFFALADPETLAALAPIQVITEPDEAAAVFAKALPVLPVPLTSAAIPGRPNIAHGAAVQASIARAVDLALSGAVDAVVTNPINKANLYQAGFTYPGHTEYLQALTGAKRAVMMLASPLLRVVPATIHIPLAKVADQVHLEDLVAIGMIMDQALRRDFAIKSPRIAVAGLNPHAGEDGTLGGEDEAIVRPAIEALRAQGINAFGPLSADTLFHADARATYDAALCQYHDQALIPIKTLDFHGGVNVTLGLPILRTSPDHGTAYDIAGHNRANPASLIAALKLAAVLADHRRHHEPA